MTRVLVTGGAGFIGSHYVHHALAAHPDWQVTVLDKLTYAGNLANLEDVKGNARYRFLRGDIASKTDVERAMEGGVDILLNFAAETHVDRSIGDPEGFIRTDIYGAYALLEAARERKVRAFVQISTDEVYGSVTKGRSRETDALMPSNPYSASKAAADRLAYSYFATYRLPVFISRASNNFGPRQYPEKVIPLFVTNALSDEPLPLYGDGQNVRDWLFVTDHCAALDVILQRGTPGEVYNLCSGVDWSIERVLNFYIGKSTAPRIEVRQDPSRLRPSDVPILRGSREKIETALGWRTTIPLETTLSDLLEYWRRRIRSRAS